jgi:hypothetical protein
LTVGEVRRLGLKPSGYERKKSTKGTLFSPFSGLTSSDDSRSVFTCGANAETVHDR